MIGRASLVGLGLLLGFALSVPAAQSRELRLEPQTAYVGDIVRLSIEYRNDIPSLYALDLRPLERDFDVLGVDSRTSRAFADDGYINRMQWEVELVPRRAGRLRLPRLAVGDWRTPARELNVLPVPDALRAAQRVSVEIAADPPNPYVGQQVNLLMRVRHNTPVTEGYWVEPRIGDALGFRGVDETAYRDPAGLDVNERVMAIFAGSAGRLQVPAASFRGRLGAWRDASGATVPSRRIYRRSQPIELQLRGVPAEFGDGPWLPALALDWSERWEFPDGESRVGDSLRRILTLEARGLPADALPADLFSAESDAFRVYPDQARRRQKFVGRDLVARLEQAFAIILTRAGRVEVPPLRLAWWDVGADRMRELELPGKTLVVSAAPRPQVAGGGDSRRAPAVWPWAGALGLLALAAIALYAVRRGWPVAVARLWRLRLACRANDPAAVRQALLDWAEYRWPGVSPVGLWQLRRRLPTAALAAELARLDAALYAPPTASWRGERLWRALRADLLPRPRRRAPAAPRLAPLYPGGRLD